MFVSILPCGSSPLYHEYRGSTLNRPEVFYFSSTGSTFSMQLRAQQIQVNGWHQSLPPTSHLQVSISLCLRMILVQLASTCMEPLQRLRYHQMCEVIDVYLTLKPVLFLCCLGPEFCFPQHHPQRRRTPNRMLVQVPIQVP